jgi:hypothetical protein
MPVKLPLAKDLTRLISKISSENDSESILDVNSNEIQTVLNNIFDSERLSSGGTSDYEDLSNKPFINSIPLVGDRSPESLGIPSLNTVQNIVANDMRRFTTSQKTYASLATM